MEKDRQLSPHFMLSEFTISQEAARKGIDNTPPGPAIQCLRDLCLMILEPLRAAFVVPVIISSGYRCPVLNAATHGSSSTSQHMEGRAADLYIPGHSLEEVFNWIYENLPFDQVIHEFNAWVHVSYDPARNRRRGFITGSRDGKTIYIPQGLFDLKKA